MRGTDNSAKWWICEKCNAQIAVSAVVYTPLDTQTSVSRRAVFEDCMGEVWKTALLVGSNGIAMREPNYCPNCGAKVVHDAD